jgi:hypothetical protein
MAVASQVNEYGAQISYRAEGWNRDEFDDGLQERFDFQPVFEEERVEFPKNYNNQYHSSRFESQIEKLLTRQVLGTSLPKFNGDVRFWPSFLATNRCQTHECQFNQISQYHKISKQTNVL